MTVAIHVPLSTVNSDFLREFYFREKALKDIFATLKIRDYVMVKLHQ